MELREGAVFFRDGRIRRVVAIVSARRPGTTLFDCSAKEHVVYCAGGDRLYRCQVSTFRRWMGGATDVSNKEIEVEGGLV